MTFSSPKLKKMYTDGNNRTLEVDLCSFWNTFPKCTLKVQQCSIWVLISTIYMQKGAHALGYILMYLRYRVPPLS